MKKIEDDDSTCFMLLIPSIVKKDFSMFGFLCAGPLFLVSGLETLKLGFGQKQYKGVYYLPKP